MRGLHIVIIDPKDGKIINAKAFDTYQSSSSLEVFINYIPYKSIVVAACKDDCWSIMSRNVKLWFRNMGSDEI